MSLRTVFASLHYNLWEGVSMGMNSFADSERNASKSIELSMAEGIARLASVDPECIYIEHVCIVFGVSKDRAKEICDQALKQGALYRQIQVLCPDGSVAALASSYEDLPPNVKCWSRREGHCEFQVIRTDALCKREIFAVRSGYIP